MHKFFLKANQFLALTFIVFFFGACSHLDHPPEEDPPKKLMEEGLDHFKTGNYIAAAEAFQKIIDRYPYSDFAVEAELKIADTYYNKKLYEDAFSAYGEFERMHPKNQNIPYVIYQKGMCHFSRVSTIDRDQSHTFQAKENFERLLKRFPNSKFTNSANRNIRRCYINLAEYELYVGHFYYKMKKYGAAMDRYRYIIETYPDLGQYHEALESVGKCREKLAEEQKNNPSASGD